MTDLQLAIQNLTFENWMCCFLATGYFVVFIVLWFKSNSDVIINLFALFLSLPQSYYFNHQLTFHDDLATPNYFQ